MRSQYQDAVDNYLGEREPDAALDALDDLADMTNDQNYREILECFDSFPVYGPRVLGQLSYIQRTFMPHRRLFWPYLRWLQSALTD